MAKNTIDPDVLHARINEVEDEVLAELKAHMERVLERGVKKVAKAYRTWRKAEFPFTNEKDVQEERPGLDDDANRWARNSLRYLVPATVQRTLAEKVGV